jgi:hypothetical protein
VRRYVSWRVVAARVAGFAIGLDSLEGCVRMADSGSRTLRFEIHRYSIGERGLWRIVAKQRRSQRGILVWSGHRMRMAVLMISICVSLVGLH